ncbi:deoxynucleoside kinase-like [Asbolus verrucosus]|uniref:Deoxynucleoside kinase-like n=1 Tax=Asbolus verrucosus TaxID=1661398 RepID=A0A482VXV2_ASBVE|nr:deoxynucleoside kinase-like [Asbolus verrucosus]
MKKAHSGRPFTIAVEGNIGSGKTTFLHHFEKLGNVTIISEPIEKWRNCNGHNLLGLMYEDPKKNAFTFQSYVQLTLLQSHTQKTTAKFKLMERSIFSARYCFVEKLQRDGILTQAGFSVIDEWFKWINQHQNVGVDLFVYLRTNPEIIYQRILNRSRVEERKVPFEYIKGLHEIHEDWLYHKTLYNCPAPVFTIDANVDLRMIEEEYEKFEDEVLNKRISKWRQQRGLPLNPNACGVLTDSPDYSFLDGRPTPYGSRQKKRILKQQELTQQIIELTSEVDFAVERHKQLQQEEQRRRQEILDNKLKPKGIELLKKKK